ncbi:MAG: 3-dehydroquinate synthase [Endomicrobium sp.]|jgi:3-dehydroquinate synthase|nr:3-dehydroquinate synthase [Endomicrobium sp.]
MMKKNLKISLKTNPYNIIISKNAQDFLSNISKIIKSKNIFVVSDSNVAKLYLNGFIKLLTKTGFNCKSAVIKSGESGKSVKTLEFLYDKALKDGLDRKSCAVALGGGVTGDITGFFAATYMRGIKFAQVPTTLLAMADSSVGGKTAVNTRGGKNIAGAFYQPSFVWINSSYLATLDIRQIKAGLAEIIKYSFTFDKKFYDYINKTLDNGFISGDDFDYMIYKSCAYKAAVVEKDEFETKGFREILNFGHTLAHALETYSGYGKYLHGEAVAVGMLFAARLSAAIKLCPQDVYKSVNNLLSLAGLKFNLGRISAAALCDLMKKDKKSVNGKIRFVLLKNIGKAVSGVCVEDDTVKKQLDIFLKENK